MKARGGHSFPALPLFFIFRIFRLPPLVSRHPPLKEPPRRREAQVVEMSVTNNDSFESAYPENYTIVKQQSFQNSTKLKKIRENIYGLNSTF